MQEQLQQAHAEQQQQLQHNPQHASSASNHHHSTAGSWPAFDAAVQQLKHRSDSSQLPGSFYGRLCNMLSISNSHASAAVAVNAALAEAANLNSTLIVSDRSNAAAVIEYFRQQRVGTVQCKILSEAPAAASNAQAAAGSSSSSRPLLECVQAVPDVTGLQGLLQQLLGSWLLVDSREEASTLMHLRRNLVTR
jgi:chromosome segregation ATPase